MIALFGIEALGAPELEVAPAAEVRAIETVPDRLVVDADGRSWGWGPALDTRLRLGLGLEAGEARAELQADLAAGQLWGSTWALSELDERGRDRRDALTAAGFVPRQAAMGYRFPWLDVELGLRTSRWGLGMVAGDGARDPLFGRSDFGDRTLRLRLATQPLAKTAAATPLYVILAGDRVVADELAVWAEGDEAWQGIAALLYRRPSPVQGLATELGVYGVVRDQHTIAPDGTRRATALRVLDATAAAPLVLDPLIVELAAEGALAVGRTEVSRTRASPDGVAVRSGGLAIRAAVRPVVREDWRGELRLALASGDGSPSDDRVTDFRFDRDYDVGFVLFDEVLAAYDLAAIRQAVAPDVALVPPDGIDSLAAEGAFHQALALQPAWTVAPLPALQLRLGAVFAWSTGPIAQPYQTFRSGGVPTNALGQPSEGRYLGTELDWAVGSRELPIAHWRLRPSIDLQVGHAWPSRALAGPTGRIDHLMLVGRLSM